MLGAGFFQEMISGKKTSKLKTYDATAMYQDTGDYDEPSNALAAETEELGEDEILEILLQEGDEDASLISDFEAASADVLQQDEELAAAYNSYAEARRRLSEKAKSRGFFPISKGKGKGQLKGGRGKFGKGHNSSRKTLQQRILESRCRLCNRVGHWKAECPLKNESVQNRQSPAATSFVQVQGEQDHLLLEFLQIPEIENPIDESLWQSCQTLVCFSPQVDSTNASHPSVYS